MSEAARLEEMYWQERLAKLRTGDEAQLHEQQRAELRDRFAMAAMQGLLATQTDAEITGDAIRLLRKQKGMTQGQLADEADLSTHWISKMERGGKVSWRARNRAAKALRLSSRATFESLAERAYSIADAMLAAREAK